MVEVGANSVKPHPKSIRILFSAPRVEPRAVKRRAKKLVYLTLPRSLARARLLQRR